MTKEQELKALGQIRKIVEGLGEDSYIGFAFESCFEMAEENIRNDFACSWKQKAESAERNIEVIKDSEEDCRKLLEKTQKDADDWRKVAHQNRDKADTMLGKYAELGEKHNEVVAKNIELQKALDEKDEEIMKLKAKLYDLLVAQDAR